MTDNSSIMPVMTIEGAVERYNAMVEFTKTVMKADKDYGVIPGTTKPTLLKPGAEKLCSLFGLSPEFNVIDKIIDFEKQRFYFHYQCRLTRNGELVATGDGSANSDEKKYSYRWQEASWKPEKSEADDLKRRGLGRWTKRKDAWVWLERVENEEKADVVNTLQKMAQKRALVAAILIGANASEFFTQDMEDIVLDVDVKEVVEEEVSTTPVPETVHVIEKSEVSTESPGDKVVVAMSNDALSYLVKLGLFTNNPNAAQVVGRFGKKELPLRELVALATSYRQWKDKLSVTGMDDKEATQAAIDNALENKPLD